MSEAKPKILREVLLWPPLRDYLKGLGFMPHPEVRGHDVVAIRGEEIWTIELKVSATYGVFRQTFRASIFSDKTYVGVGTKVRASSLERARKLGVGVIEIREGRIKIVQESEPHLEAQPCPKRHAAMVEALRNRIVDESVVAGVPNLKGEGPAQRCQKLIAAYMVEHPDASWQEIFARVPNHYAHHKSMSQCHFK